MKPLIGEYSCKLDAKGRLSLPAGLKRQLPEAGQAEFVLKRGFEKCLELYPLSVWEQQLEQIQRKNPFEQKTRDFIRLFTNGAQPIELDESSRVLISRRLMDYAGIDKDVSLVCQINYVEIWDEKTYEAWINDPARNLSKLAEDVMGGEAAL